MICNFICVCVAVIAVREAICRGRSEFLTQTSTDLVVTVLTVHPCHLYMYCMRGVTHLFIFHPVRCPRGLSGEVTRASCSSVPLHQLIHSQPTPTPLSTMPEGGYMVQIADNRACLPTNPLMVPSC